MPPVPRKFIPEIAKALLVMVAAPVVLVAVAYVGIVAPLWLAANAGLDLRTTSGRWLVALIAVLVLIIGWAIFRLRRRA